MAAHTRFVRITGRVGWLSAEQNVDAEQARRHADGGNELRQHEVESVWVPNAVAAAAPDLLALAKRALNESARVRPDFADEIRAAIAKAEG